MIHSSHIMRCVVGLMLLFLLSLCSCGSKHNNPYSKLSLDYYSKMRKPNLAVEGDEIRKYIAQYIASDGDTVLRDASLKRYYLGGGNFVWVSRLGIDNRADTLFSFLSKVSEDGFSVSKYHIDDMKADVAKLQSLNADSINNINKLMARLEYNLSKAYLLYCRIYRYGCINPYQTFNKLDLIDDENPRSGFHSLYDVPTEVAKADFLPTIFRHTSEDSLGTFLRSIQPQNPLYYQLRKTLASASSRYGRMKIMVNMERCRWRVADLPSRHTEYVMVNIPSYMLRAVSCDTLLQMKIVCGADKTKTPLITSHLKRIDINPQWIIPHSILKKDVARHAQSEGYFASHRYFIRNRATGKKVPVSEVTTDMLLSGAYSVVQEGGAGNALGRIIFRFDNNLSIYLHDTSSPSVFLRTDRRASHGCVRVEKPYQLAAFVLGDDNQKLLAKINYSIRADVSPLGKSKSELSEQQLLVSDTLKRNMLIGAVNIPSQVPLFITYFTLYPLQDGTLEDYPDVYGYDDVIAKKLKRYI